MAPSVRTPVAGVRMSGAPCDHDIEIAAGLRAQLLDRRRRAIAVLQVERERNRLKSTGQIRRETPEELSWSSTRLIRWVETGRSQVPALILKTSARSIERILAAKRSDLTSIMLCFRRPSKRVAVRIGRPRSR